jgi:PAS domain S-box-containing protein
VQLLALSSQFAAEWDNEFKVVWDDGERVLCRGWRRDADGSRRPVLAVLPATAHPTPSSLDRLVHEYALKDALDGAWAARPLALGQERGRTMLVLEDPGGEFLEGLLGQPMSLGPFLRLALGLALAVARLHQRELIHKDIKPAHILVKPATGAVWLTGFGIASRLRRQRPSPDPPGMIAGTLAYMAPEQTGRMNRSVDARSDLYAVGVVLYRMLTGQLPFRATEPMEWVHCHIARQPVPPAERVPGVPAVLSAIVMKLLAKMAEERYQTATGLAADLDRCLAGWERDGSIAPFAPGVQDIPDQLRIPEKLYGREREVGRLLAAFDRVVAQGRPELVLVAGYSGIGKSAVVNELHKVLVPLGLFAAGKFDQSRRDVPYATLAQAVQSLVRQILGESDAAIGRWRAALGEALGPNGRLMVDLVPQLKLIIGEQPPVPELPPQDAQRRFQLVVRRLLGVFARAEHPLVLFLDDLQWLDPATLDLLEDLLTQPEVSPLLLIGAYRDNEVDAAHPLRRTLAAIRQAGKPVQDITLAPLARDHLGQMIADALRCEPARAVPLAQLLHAKTAGNPFFTIQFLTALAEEGLLSFEHASARWAWDLSRIEAKGYTDNVVDLLVGKLHRLPVATRNALQQLACLGNSATLPMLAIVLGTAEEQVHADLWEAVRLELVLRPDGAYRFIHDRVQEAAYSLIPEDLRTAAHLRIGRLLVAHTPPAQREEAIFEIVNQLNRGAPLITSQDEREQLAELNLIAGQRAKASTAYASALNYLTAGAALLAKDCWERRHELSFALELNQAECEFLTGALEEAEQRLAALSGRAANTVERGTVACLRIDLYVTLARSGRAIAVGLEYLQHLGFEWSPHPTEEEVRREYERIWSQLGDRTIEELVDLPLMSDPASLVTLDVLTKLCAPAYNTDANLLALLPCRAINLSLERGNSDGSCYAYAFVALVAGSRFGYYEAAYRFGRLGYDLVEQRGLKRFQARVYDNFGIFALPWAKHIKVAQDMLGQALDAASKIGDLTFVAYSCANLTTCRIVAGDPLVDVQREAEIGLAFAQRSRFEMAAEIISGQLGLVRTLRGLTRKFGSFDDAQCDEVQLEHRFASNANLQLAECFHWIHKLQARFFAGDYLSATEASSRAQKMFWTSLTFPEVADFQFYGALSRAAFYDSALPDQQQHLKALEAHYRLLEIWAKRCPENFENRAALVGAEIARIEGRVLDAEHLYERAIRSAQASGFVHNEALAYELAARFYAARGFEEFARGYLRNARYGYLRWGADGKVRQLDEMYPHLRTEAPAPGPMGMIATPVDHLDLATVIKVSQAVSGEIVLEKLIDTVMRTAIEQAGAERGLLILSRGVEPRIEAEAATDGDTVAVQLRDQSVTAADLPESVLNYVLRTQDSVILDGAAQPPFADDPYLRQHQARSILCLPLITQARLIGVLYLENSLTSGVFVQGRIAVLKLLASQAAIALENARLYGDLAEREAKIRRLVDANIIGICIWRCEGDILEANNAFLKIVGYDRDDLVAGQLRWTDLTTPESRDRTARALEELQRTGTIQPFEKEYFRRDGSRVPVLVGVAAFDEEQDQLVAFVLDLTDRKRAEEELRRSEASLAQAQQISRTGSWRWNVGTGEVRWSTEHFRIFSLNPLTARPSFATFMERIHPEDRPSFEQVLDQALRDRSRFQHEYRIALPDGSVKYLQSVGQPDSTESGDLEFVGTVMDMTERRHAEEALRSAQAELIRVARLTTMGELLASIAHEVNQPLAAVATSGGACLRWLNRDQPDLDAAREAASRVVRDAHRAGDVIRSLRALTKKSGPQLTKLDIHDAIAEVLALTHGELQRHGVVLHTGLSGGDRPVLGDRVQLQQVLLNLVMNAVQAMGAVTGRRRELTVSVALAEPGRVQVAVADTGPGLDPAIAQRIFEPFFTTKSDGLGMGLSICRSIIEAHGGRLWVSPRAPHGTVFHFTIPIAG